MNVNKNSFNDKKIKNAVKKIVLEAKKRNIIKPHTEAFKTHPVTKEVHKGKLDLIK